MKIIKFKKTKNSLYLLELDNNEEIEVHEDLILKHELLLNKEIKNKEALIEENKKYLAYDLSLRYIARKEISKKELREYLKKKEYDDLVIDETIERLVKEKALDELRLTRAYIKTKLLTSSDGPYKIKRNLLDKEIPELMIDEELVVFTKEEQLKRISKLKDKYLKSKRNKSFYNIKNSLYAYLSNLGYEKSYIVEAIDNLSYDETSAREKEYEKLKKVLARKYSGDELERKIKAKLYERGFQ